MKVRSVVPFPMSPHNIISRDTAMKMIGQKFPATDQSHNKIGESEIIDVDWRGENDILITIEMDVQGPIADQLNEVSKGRYSIANEG